MFHINQNNISSLFNPMSLLEVLLCIMVKLFFVYETIPSLMFLPFLGCQLLPEAELRYTFQSSKK